MLDGSNVEGPKARAQMMSNVLANMNERKQVRDSLIHKEDLNFQRESRQE